MSPALLLERHLWCGAPLVVSSCLRRLCRGRTCVRGLQTPPPLPSKSVPCECCTAQACGMLPAALAACWLQRHVACSAGCLLVATAGSLQKLQCQNLRWPGPAFPAQQRMSRQPKWSHTTSQLLCWDCSCVLPVLLVWSGAPTAPFKLPGVWQALIWVCCLHHHLLPSAGTGRCLAAIYQPLRRKSVRCKPVV